MILTALVCFGLLVAPASADVLQVPDDYPTIQLAIQAATTGDVVRVAPGTYIEDIDFLGKDVTVLSSLGAEWTIIQGTGSGPVVSFDEGESESAALLAFTVTGGTGRERSGARVGGGIYVDGASPTLAGNWIQGNEITGAAGTEGQAAYGGGMFMANSQSVVTGNIFRENRVRGGTSPDEDGIIGRGGDAYGGGLYLLDCDVELSANLFSKNRAEGGQDRETTHASGITLSTQAYGGEGRGGALFAQGGTLVLEGEQLEDNLSAGGDAWARDAGSGNDYQSALARGGSGFGGGLAFQDITSLIVLDVTCQSNEVFGGSSDNESGDAAMRVAPGAAVGAGLWASGGGFLLERGFLRYNAAEGGVGRWMGAPQQVGDVLGAGMYLNCDGQIRATRTVHNLGSNAFYPEVPDGILRGGGAHLDGAIQVVNSYFANNELSGSDLASGAAIEASRDVELLFVTAAWNRGAPAMGGLSPIRMRCSVVYHHAEGPGTIQADYSDIQGGLPGVGNFDADPSFIIDGYYYIDEDSPCINRGIDLGVDTDIDGDRRPVEGGFDVGADERPTYEPTPKPTPEVGVGCRLVLNNDSFQTGEPFLLTMEGWNHTPQDLELYQFVMLEAGGEYWFGTHGEGQDWFEPWPEWPQDPDPPILPLHTGQTFVDVILDFDWPSDTGQASNIRFWGLLVERGSNRTAGELTWVEFGYG